MNPKTAQQINDPQTVQAITSRHSALSELMVQNVELRSEIQRLKAECPRCEVCNSELTETGPSGVDGCPTLDCKVCSLKAENSNLKHDLALWAKYFDKQWPKDVHETIERLKSRNARLNDEVMEWEEREGSCCPENTSFVTVIKRLKAENASLKDLIELDKASAYRIIDNLKADNARLRGEKP